MGSKERAGYDEVTGMGVGVDRSVIDTALKHGGQRCADSRRGRVDFPAAWSRATEQRQDESVAMLDDAVEEMVLKTVSIDAKRRTARVGAGVTWAALNAAAEPYGLLGLAGSAPDVGVVGYTVFGGVGG